MSSPGSSTNQPSWCDDGGFFEKPDGRMVHEGCAFLLLGNEGKYEGEAGADHEESCQMIMMCREMGNLDNS